MKKLINTSLVLATLLVGSLTFAQTPAAPKTAPAQTAAPANPGANNGVNVPNISKKVYHKALKPSFCHAKGFVTGKGCKATPATKPAQK